MVTAKKQDGGAPQTPLGGRLVERTLQGDRLAAALERAQGLPRIMIDREAEITFEMVATGVFSPLTGTLGRADSETVIEHGRLADGTPWPIPLTFAPAGRRNREVIEKLREGDEVLLVSQNGQPVALQRISETFTYDREKRAQRLFGTTSPEVHPGVDAIFRRMGELSLAGEIELLDRPSWGSFERYRMTPRETYRLLYEERGYRSVAGFITGANPPHIGHEYMHRTALEAVDAILLLPQVELERPEYVKPDYRIQALEALTDVYYPPFRVVLSALRTNYLFAGPREAVLHAIIMRNYGCTHALIGRDHAGVGDVYDMYASHRIFDEYSPEELGIKVVAFSEVFYCARCRMPATENTCPHDTRYRVQISGTGIREVLRRGFFPPKEICRPEVSHIAMQGVVPSGGGAGTGSKRGVYAPGQTIHSLFSFYEVAYRLGGYLRPQIIGETSLGERDLEAALLDVRSHADRVYEAVFDEMAEAGEANRSLAARWRTEAREILIDHQADLLAQLQEKRRLLQAGEWLDQAEEGLEGDISRAERVLEQHPRPLHPDAVRARLSDPAALDWSAAKEEEKAGE